MFAGPLKRCAAAALRLRAAPVAPRVALARPFAPNPLQANLGVRGVGYQPNNNKAKSQEGMWVDLLDNPEDWLDYRGLKEVNAVNPRFPDFKNGKTKEALWLTSFTTPSWVHRTHFNVPAQTREGMEEAQLTKKQDAGATALAGEGRREDAEAVSHPALVSWKSLFEEQRAWIDFRAAKKAGEVVAEHPDFKNKYSGEALWINSKFTKTPGWVLDRLLLGHNVWQQFEKQEIRLERLWRDLFDNWESWQDFRKAKLNGQVHERYPDFKKDKDNALWVESKRKPAWVDGKLEAKDAEATALAGEGRREDAEELTKM